MAKQFPALLPEHTAFIAAQHLFFVASAASDGRVNVSPKGLGGFRVLSDRAVAYLDLTGSGAETAAHLKADGRLTVMFCAFDGEPVILRLYGQGRSLVRGSADYADLLAGAFGGQEPAGARQIVLLDIDLVQTSCGYGVPLYDYREERSRLTDWAASQDIAAMDAYRRRKNTLSIDGLPTGLA